MKDELEKDGATHSLTALLILVFQLGSSLWLGWQSMRLPFDNRIDRFAVHGETGEHAYRQFREAFGAPEHFLVVLQSKAALDGGVWETGEALFEELSQAEGVKSYQSLGTILPKGVAPSPEILPFPFVHPENRLYSAIFEWVDLPQRERQLKQFQEIADSLRLKYQDKTERLVIAGEPIVNYQLNLSSQEVKSRFFPLLIALSLLFMGSLFRSLKVLVVTGLAVCSSLTWTMGIMALLGESLNLVTTLIPALIFVLAVAMQVHILIGIGHRGSVKAGVKSKLPPNFLVALTTSLGFGSLMLSHVDPIAVMGKYMAIGIWLIFAWSHLTHYGISMLWHLQFENPKLPCFDQTAQSELYRRWSHQPKWAFGAVGIIALGFWWLPRNPAESNGLMYFHESHPIRQVTGFLQSQLTGASQLEILLARPKNASEDYWRGQLELLGSLEHQIRSLDHVRHVLSPARFAEFTSQIFPIMAINAKGGWQLLQAQRPALLNSYRTRDFYRIQLLVDSLDKDAYDQLRARIETILAESPVGKGALVTGPLARIIEIQRYLLQSLALSLGTTILVVLVLMMIFLGVWRQPSLILLPNLLPLACMSLAMGVFEMRTTISSVMVFSIAFGIAVDDTIHLLYSFKHCKEPAFWDRWRAVFLQDARAISLTTLTLTAGFLVLATSGFLPTRDFGLLMGFGMICALLSDLLLLPPLLRAARLGWMRSQ